MTTTHGRTAFSAASNRAPRGVSSRQSGEAAMIEQHIDIPRGTGRFRASRSVPKGRVLSRRSFSTWTRRASAKSCATWRGASQAGLFRPPPRHVLPARHAAFRHVSGARRPYAGHLRRDEFADQSAGRRRHRRLARLARRAGKSTPGPVGCIGYCMSGKFVTTVAATLFQPLRRLGFALRRRHRHRSRKIRRILLADKIKGRMYFGFAEHDEHVPANVIPTLKDSLGAAGVKYQLEIYPGSHHGYQFPSATSTTRTPPKGAGRKSTKCGPRR